MNMDKDIFLKRDSAYGHFQGTPMLVSEKELSFALDKARFDPRLMEVCTEHIRDFWWNMDPEILNDSCKTKKYPFMIKVATTLIASYCKSDKKILSDFKKWTELTCQNIDNPPPQLLYIGELKIASKAMSRELNEAIPEVFKLGLIVRDLPFNKQDPKRICTRENPPENKTRESQLMKSDIVMKIKKLKKTQTNEELIEHLQTNRVTLSKILNNKIDGITLDYLVDLKTYL